MSTFARQAEAMRAALILIQLLPVSTVWALTCTNDDDSESPSVLNIYVESTRWDDLQSTLFLGRATDRSTHTGSDQFLSFRQGTLLISLIEPEDK